MKKTLINPRKEFMEGVLKDVGLLQISEDIQNDLQLVEERDYEQEQESIMSESIDSSNKFSVS